MSSGRWTLSTKLGAHLFTELHRYSVVSVTLKEGVLCDGVYSFNLEEMTQHLNHKTFLGDRFPLIVLLPKRGLRIICYEPENITNFLTNKLTSILDSKTDV